MYVEAAECLKILAHPKRLKILSILKKHNGLNVKDISEQSGLPQNVTSEHLRLMLRCNFLDFTKVGRDTYYKITEPQVLKILKCIEEKYS